MPKRFTKEYDYIHGENGGRYQGVIEADSPEELRQLMQDELNASGGTLAPEEFTSPHFVEPLVREVPTVLDIMAEKLEEANDRLKSAGLPEVEIPPDVKVIIDRPIESNEVKR